MGEVRYACHMKQAAAQQDAFRKRVLAARERIKDRVEGIDPGDLLLILQCLLRSPSAPRRFFLRKLGPNRNGF